MHGGEKRERRGREKAIAEAHLPACPPACLVHLPTRFISPIPSREAEIGTDAREDRRCAGHESPVAATGVARAQRRPADQRSAACSDFGRSPGPRPRSITLSPCETRRAVSRCFQFAFPQLFYRYSDRSTIGDAGGGAPRGAIHRSSRSIGNDLRRVTFPEETR